MALPLATVQEYIARVRDLLQDTVPDYRYTDASLLDALNNAMLEAYRIRPDIFLGITPFPNYITNDTTPVVLDLQFRMGIVYYMAGYAQLRDDETDQDQRATVFMNKFVSQLTTVAA